MHYSLAAEFPQACTRASNDHPDDQIDYLQVLFFGDESCLEETPCVTQCKPFEYSPAYEITNLDNTCTQGSTDYGCQ